MHTLPNCLLNLIMKDYAMRILLITGLLSLSFLTGCIQVEETITLNADGSGTMELAYSVAEEQAAMMESAVSGEEALEAGEDFSFSADAIRKQFQEMEFEGVELLRADSSVQNGRRNISMAVKFKSLAALSETPLLSERSVALKKTGEGLFTFSQKASAPAVSAESGAEMAAFMQSMLQGLKVEIRVKAPGPITESNATETNGNEARWVFDIATDPNALSKIQNLDVQISFKGDDEKLSGFRDYGTK